MMVNSIHKGEIDFPKSILNLVSQILSFEFFLEVPQNIVHPFDIQTWIAKGTVVF